MMIHTYFAWRTLNKLHIWTFSIINFGLNNFINLWQKIFKDIKIKLNLLNHNFDMLLSQPYSFIIWSNNSDDPTHYIDKDINFLDWNKGSLRSAPWLADKISFTPTMQKQHGGMFAALHREQDCELLRVLPPQNPFATALYPATTGTILITGSTLALILTKCSKKRTNFCQI